jgi:hypothetical protein
MLESICIGMTGLPGYQQCLRVIGVFTTTDMLQELFGIKGKRDDRPYRPVAGVSGVDVVVTC